MARNKLTTRQIESMVDAGLYGDGENLYLKISPTGVRSFVFRFKTKDPITAKPVTRALGLGPYGPVTLAQARERADEMRAALADNRDPAIEREHVKQSKRRAQFFALPSSKPTFEDIAREHIKVHAAGLTNPKAAQQWANTLRDYAYPRIGSVPIDEVTTKHLTDILAPIWLDKAETAKRVRGRIEAVLARATALGMRSGPNPATYKGSLEYLLPSRKTVKVKHHAMLRPDLIPQLWATLDGERALAALALKLTILTACRTSEVLGLLYEEIDETTDLIELPPARMKARNPHVIPITPHMQVILREIAKHRLAHPESNPLVFPGERLGRPLSNMSMLMLLRRLNLGQYTVHGFRAAFKTWASDETDTPREIIEACLAHTGDKLERAYNRGSFLERRRVLLTQWGEHCTQPAAPLFYAIQRKSKRKPRIEAMTQGEVRKAEIAKTEGRLAKRAKTA
jgi:integrase